jgi:hypothetical protein
MHEDKEDGIALQKKLIKILNIILVENINHPIQSSKILMPEIL